MIKVAQLGCGYWGPNLLRNFSSSENCLVKWVAEESEERRGYVKENYPKTNTTDDWEKAVSDPDVDAVVIATPASTHYEIAKVALEFGKHVLVEKPFATSVKDAVELGELAKSKGLVLMAGHTFIYNAAVHHIKKLLDSNDLGEIYYFYSQRLNLGQARSDVNAWWNLAPHDISIMLYLMGDNLPVSIAAHGMDYLQDGVEDVVFATLTWANKITAHIHVSWLDPKRYRKTVVVGSRKMLVYDDTSENKIAVFDKGIDKIPHIGEKMDYDDLTPHRLFQRTGDVLMPKIDFKEPLATEVAHFLSCISEKRDPQTGPEQSIPVVAVLEAGDKALKSGETVQIKYSQSTSP